MVFDGGTDGANPAAGLLQGSDGNFYGTTQSGGANGQGTVYQVGSTVSLTNIYSFPVAPMGRGGLPGLVQGSDGNFYWTMYNGGTNYLGVVFRLTVPLNPPPNQITSAKIAGSNFVFTVASIAGETYQLQFTTDLTSGIWSNIPGISVTNSIGSILTLTIRWSKPAARLLSVGHHAMTIQNEVRSQGTHPATEKLRVIRVGFVVIRACDCVSPRQAGGFHLKPQMMNPLPSC